MENRTGAGSGNMAGGESVRRRRRTRSQTVRRLRQQRARQDIGFLSRLMTYGELQLMPRRLSQRLHLPLFVELYNVQFFQLKKRYLWQSALAALVMLLVLLLVDSVADAVLAAGLGSSAVIIFVHPNSSGAALRHLVGGHLIGLAVGILSAFVLFHSGWVLLPPDVEHWAADVGAAITLGLVILLMSITDTEHPPGAATGLGFALQSLESTLVLLFVVAVLTLAVSKVLFRRSLRDLD